MGITQRQVKQIRKLRRCLDMYVDEYGNNVNDFKYRGKNAMMKYIVLNKYYLVNFLLYREADPNYVASNGHTPMGFAIKYNRPYILSRLLHNGGNPNQICFGKSLLYRACTAGNEKIVRMLVNAGATLQECDDI